MIDRQEVLNVIFNIMTDKKIKHKHRALNRNIKQLKIINKRDGLVQYNDNNYIIEMIKNGEGLPPLPDEAKYLKGVILNDYYYFSDFIDMVCWVGFY